MELFLEIFRMYSAIKDASQLYDHVSDWVFEKVSNWSRSSSTRKIEKEVGEIATFTDQGIRAVAAKRFAGVSQSAIPEAKREELIGVLINLARNVRNRTAYGTMSGSSLRSDRHIEGLLSNVEPLRHQNERVAAESPWVLRRHLGMGSFGEVWMAENPAFPVRRAYKFFTDDSSGQWLRRELNSLKVILTKLGEHDHIVKFEDADNTKAKYPYLAFEYMAGGSLEDWIVKDKDQRPALEPAEIIRQVVDGLAAAHDQMIYHRDIKPANILLSEGPDVRIKIGDFGLAKVGGPLREGHSQYASTAGSVGTALYLPPESQQRSGRRSAPQDDVFALGVVWYQLAVDAIERPPYDFAERLRSHGVDSHTIKLIERCLAHPDRRFRDAQEVAAALGDPLPPVSVPPPGVPDVQHIAREYLATLTY